MKIKFCPPGRGFVSGLVAAVCLSASPALAEVFSNALVKAYQYHPNLAATRANLRAADEGVVQERAASFGTVTGDYAYGVTNSDGIQRRVGGGLDGSRRDSSDEVSLGLVGTIPIYAGGRIENAVRGAEENVNATRAELESVEQDVLLAAVTAYEDVRRDIQRVALSRNNVRVISEQLRAARDRFEVGEVTRTDVSQAEARLASSRATLAAVTGALAASRQNYLAAIGDLPQDLQRPPPLPDLPDSLNAAVALAEANHPQIQVARFNARQAEFGVKSAIGLRLPTLNLQGSLRYANDLTTSNSARGESQTATIGLAGEVPIWTGGRNPSIVREAQARLASQQAQIHEIARQIRQQTAIAWTNLAVARASIRAAQQQIKAAQIAFDGVKEEATLGARTTLDVLDAEQELVSARVDLVDSKRDEYVAAYQLLASVGSLTVRHLGLKVDRYDPAGYVEKINESPYTYDRDESTEWSSSLRP